MCVFREEVPELNLDRYQINETSTLNPNGILYCEHLNESGNPIEISKGLEFLRNTYTNKTGYEFMYIEVRKKIW